MRNSMKIVSSKNCECGCYNLIPLRKWHFCKSAKIPRFILGHNPETQFKNNNKVSFKMGECLQNGYMLIYSPDHPNKTANNQVKRSRLTVEKSIGRYLLKDEVVHHINGNRLDDKIENLEITTNSEHLSHHHKNTNQKRGTNGQFIK